MAAQCKTFEIRDEGTHIPALAIKLDPQCERDRYVYASAGYGSNLQAQTSYVILHKLSDRRTEYAPHAWGGYRTMRIAHEYITHRWDDISSGHVVDVRYILGETDTPCESDNAGREQQLSSVSHS